MTTGAYVCRWFLERRDATAASADVVNPVTYVIGADVPAAWRPYIINAIHEWEPAFDAIGFRHALAIRVASAGDSIPPARNLVVIHQGSPNDRLVMVTTCQGLAATGQLTRCDISLNGEYFQNAGQKACTFTAGSDPVVPLPCPDSILGALFQGSVAHEVGHSLGLHHNSYAGVAYPTDSLRSAAFVHRWGYQPSVMGYVMYDQLAQPVDHIPFEELIHRVGPYDAWVIAWTYRPIPSASTPEAERPTLERWISAQDTAPYLRSGDRDAVGSAEDGGNDLTKAIPLKAYNSARVWRRLFAQDTVSALQLLRTMDMTGQWSRKLLRVGNLIGTAADPEQQLRAVRVILAYAFYQQNPFLQILDNFAMRRSLTASSVVTDSVPLLFDTSATSRFPDAAVWQQVQQQVLANLVSHIPQLPVTVMPLACADLVNANRALARAKLTGAANQDVAIRTLQETLVGPVAQGGSCTH